MRFYQEKNRLVCIDKGSTLWIEPWGTNSLRVRMTKEATMDPHDWALQEKPVETEACIQIETKEFVEPWYRGEERKRHIKKAQEAYIKNGSISAKVNREGWISFYNGDGKLLLEEYWRNRIHIDRYAVPTGIDAREMKAVLGADVYTLKMRFEAYENEKIFGMGQYQEMNLNKKGCILELAQRNSQASVPFMISNRGYGFLWNNPAIGTVVFGENKTEWVAERTKKLDYFITAGETPKQIISQYAAATGKAPMMPEYGLGFWQCRLRYRNQKEVLEVVREHKRRNLPLDVIVIDFFHWTMQGDFKFDPHDWPDVEGMVKELKDYNVELMVSVWPTVDKFSENRHEMEENGYLIKTDRGLPINMNWMGETTFFDPFHPGARKFVWEKCKKNYYDKGIRAFWLDEAEPEFGPYDFDLYRYYDGSAMEVSNFYPLMYAKAFYDGMIEAGQENVMNLVRCAWAGSQKYGALIWSGDVHSSFRALREQIQAGINMGIAGIPWWTTDIGGFLGGDPQDEEFKELMVRWFEWGAFSPVFRLHGARQPFIQLEEEYRNGVKQFTSGQDNEVWSYGEENYEIFVKYLKLREQLKPYLRECMKDAHETGLPVMRAMFLEFPNDLRCWEVDGQYMLGEELLVAPVTHKGERKKTVYLPEGTEWIYVPDKSRYEGGQTITVEAPLSIIPVFTRSDSMVSITL